MAMQNNKQSLSRRWEDYQPSKSLLAGACVATAVATMVIGFNWGGWVSGSTALTQSKAAGEIARGELASTICIERFKAAPDSAAQLTALKALPDAYKKRDFVEAGGWATMPGDTSANRRGAESCSVALTA